MPNYPTIPIPGRLTSASVEGVVTGANEIYDDDLGKRLSEINVEVAQHNDRLTTLELSQSIVIDGGNAGIASALDLLNPTPENRGKIPNVGAIIDSGILDKTEILYDDLIEKRLGYILIPGQWYRITDYVTTTTQTDTLSANHRFDIIVLALDSGTLSEEAYAITHAEDTYFANSNLEAWKIWYCPDNDTTRFAWADADNGKGVIYRMIDEWENECPYDFKNIQFKVGTNSSIGTKDNVYYYTFSLASGENDSSVIDYSLSSKCHNNKIKSYISGDKLKLKSNIFRNTTDSDICAYNYLEENFFKDTEIYLKKDNQFYPVAHPDLSTQPSILPQRFGNLPIHEVLIANGRENEIPNDAVVIEAFSFNQTQCVAAFVEKDGFRIKEEWKYPFVYGDKTPYDSYTHYSFQFPIGINDIPEESYGNIKIKFREYDFWCHVRGSSGLYYIDAIQSGITYGEFSRGSSNIYIDSPYTVESVHYTDETVQVKEKVKGWSISNDKDVVPEFTLIRYVGADNGYYYYASKEEEDKVHLLCTLTMSDGSAVNVRGKGSELTYDQIRNYDYQNIKSAVISDNVTSIGVNAFTSCSSLASVTIPNSVTSIGTNVFNSCSGLASVTCLAENVPTTGYGVFIGVDQSHATLYVPSSSIEEYRAANQWKKFGTIEKAVLLSGSCGGNVNFKLYDDGELNIYGTGAMSDFTYNGTPYNDYLSGITSVTIESGVTSIGSNAFYGCSGLTSIAIPNGVTSIGSSAFGVCMGLTSITIPNSVTSIEYHAFEGCKGLTSVTIGNSVTSIGNYAFSNCVGLTSITIPDSVTSIGSNAFYRCTKLTSITCQTSTAPTIQSNTFKGVKTNGKLYVPVGSTGYDTWMQNVDYYLGKYGWNKVEQ